MQSLDMFSDRLRVLIGSTPVTVFAKKADVSEGTLRNLLKGGDPKLSSALRIAVAGNTTLGWLVGESGLEERVKYAIRTSDGQMPYKQVGDESQEYNQSFLADFEQINLYEVKASAGHGSAVISDNFKLLYFRKEWFDCRGLNATRLVAVNVVGDSMEPDIPDESVVLVDTTQKEIKNGAVYVFTHNDDLLIKRMMATVEGYKAKSINPLYDDMEFDKQDVDKLNVVGRAVRALPDIKL